MTDPKRPPLKVQLVGGPTMVIEYGGVRLVTDPTFDPPGSYDVGGRTLTKLSGPALSPEDIGPVDVVLLSHDQHVDNLDGSGRLWMASIPMVFTTSVAAVRIPGTTALPNWQSVDLKRPGGGTIRITGLPAQHGPDGSEHLVGMVTGFMLEGQGLPTLYVSGDNASLRVVQSIAQRFPVVDLAILFCGAARTPLLGHHNLTLSSSEAVTASRILNVQTVVPAHFEGWAHFTEGGASLSQAFAFENIPERLHLLMPGEKFWYGSRVDRS